MRTYYPQCRAILQVIFDGFAEDARDTDPVIIPVLPTEARIQRNSYRQADSWELTFEANDLPIDPRLIRGGAAEIFLFEVPGITDDQRILNRQAGFENTANRKPRDAVDAIQIELDMLGALSRFTLDQKPQIAGLFDSTQLELSGSGKWVTISGQDYTDFLIRKQWPPLPNGRARRIPTGKRLDILLREILADADEEGRLRILVEGIKETDLPIVGQNEVACHKRGIPVTQETKFWDIMYKLATRHGFILFVRGLDVVLSQPQNLSEATQHRIRRMAWGHNLESLELSRELGKEKVPTVVIKSYDPKTRRTITVDHPAGAFSGAKRKRRKAGTGAPSIREESEYQIFTVYGITNLDALRTKAETLYNLLGRPERKVRFRTKDLRDFKGNPILDLASGDAVTIGFADFNFELLSNDNVPEQVKFNHLVSRGYGEAIAQVIARSYTKLQFLERPLRVREATFEYSVTDGISIEAELIDFIVVDGIRDRAAKKSRKEKRNKKLVRRDGSVVGQ